MDKCPRRLGSERVPESLQDAGKQEGCRPSLLGTLLLQRRVGSLFPVSEGVGGGLGGPLVLSWPRKANTSQGLPTCPISCPQVHSLRSGLQAPQPPWP